MLSHSAVEPSHRRKWSLVADEGFAVRLFVPQRWPEAGRTVAAAPIRRGRLAVEVLPAAFTGRVARWIPAGLGARLDAFRPDLVHAEEEPYGLACWTAARAARRCGAAFSFFTWENLVRRYTWPQRRVLAGCLAAARGAVAGNREAAVVLRRRGFRRRVAVIPQYGVDPRRFRPRSRTACRRALGWTMRGDLVGFAGRLLPEKGVETLLTAVRDLPPNVGVAIVGAGHHATRLRRLAAGLGGQAAFLPPVPRGRMPLVLGALDVLVLPSRTTPEWKEQFGRVLAEAQACGRWAIGSNSGEIPAVLGSRSLVFPEGDAAALAKRLRRALGRRPPAAHRRRALARFSDAAVARRTARFLRAMLR